MADSAVIISRIESKKDFKDFLHLPWNIYKNNPYWVPPLLMNVKDTLNEKKYPFWHHAQKELFLARRNGETVGRIAAIIDENNNKFHEEKMGFFGFFECIDDQAVANALFDEAKKWCKAKGMTHLRGPASPSLNDECAFLLEGFDSKPTVMMPYTPKYYLKLSETYGFKKAKDLVAFLKLGSWGMPDRFVKMINRMKKRMNLKITSLSLKHFDRDVEKLMSVYNAAWERNWGFVPMTEEEMLHTAKIIKGFGDPDLVKIAEIDGKPVGISITLPNLNEILDKLNGRLFPVGAIKYMYYKNKVQGVRSIIGGTIKEYRNTGIIAALFYETELTVLSKNLKWCELGWNLEDNKLINDFDMAIGAKIYKKYRFYEMPI